MLGTCGAFTSARVAIVDAEGAVRVATVERVLAGNAVDHESSDFPRIREILPGFAVDPAGGRAYLVPAFGPVAEVDLETLAVTYHELNGASCLRAGHWLVPAAQAKELEGPVRTARWLGDGLIAVSGMDYSMLRISTCNEVEIGTPAGVSLIDTSSWTTHRLSGEASEFAVAPGGVIAQGGS